MALLDVAWKNSEIQAYIKEQREEEDSEDAYEHFEKLAGKSKSYKEAKRNQRQM